LALSKFRLPRATTNGRTLRWKFNFTSLLDCAMNITCQKLNEQDLDRLTALIRVYENVFEMHNFSMPHTDHLQTLLTNGKIIFYTALLNNVVVGGLTAHILSST